MADLKANLLLAKIIECTDKEACTAKQHDAEGNLCSHGELTKTL